MDRTCLGIFLDYSFTNRLLSLQSKTCCALAKLPGVSFAPKSNPCWRERDHSRSFQMIFLRTLIYAVLVSASHQAILFLQDLVPSSTVKNEYVSSVQTNSCFLVCLLVAFLRLRFLTSLVTAKTLEQNAGRLLSSPAKAACSCWGLGDAGHAWRFLNFECSAIIFQILCREPVFSWVVKYCVSDLSYLGG